MASELRMLLPHAVVAISACLLLVAGRFVKQGAWTRAFTLLALISSAACLAQVSAGSLTPTREVALDPLSLATQWAAWQSAFCGRSPASVRSE
jgi:hypothetical protein